MLVEECHCAGQVEAIVAGMQTIATDVLGQLVVLAIDEKITEAVLVLANRPEASIAKFDW